MGAGAPTRVRRAGQDDVAALGALVAACRGGAGVGVVLDGEVRVVEGADGSLVAAAVERVETGLDGRSRTRLSDLLVHPERTGGGATRALLDDVERRAAAAGRDEVLWDVDRARLDHVAVARRRGWLHLRSGWAGIPAGSPTAVDDLVDEVVAAGRDVATGRSGGSAGPDVDREVRVVDLSRGAAPVTDRPDVLLLVDDQLGAAGDDAERLLAAAADACAPGGALVVRCARAEVDVQAGRPGPAPTTSPAPSSGPRGFDAAGLEHLLEHRGVRVERLVQLDDELVAVGRVPRDEAERSAVFVSSLPLVLLASAVVCRDRAGRLLCVHDSFKRHWTVPGGVVDAGEDPQTAAVRETFEEAGVRVRTSGLAGVFSSARPGRTLFVYDAVPVEPDDDATLHPVTRFPHEIDAVEWLPVDDALVRINPRTRWQVERCLDSPGGTWRE